jgi:hypothetical protein
MSLPVRLRPRVFASRCRECPRFISSLLYSVQQYAQDEESFECQGTRFVSPFDACLLYGIAAYYI